MDTRLLLGIILILSFEYEARAAPITCSCFTIHDKGLTWPAARQSCQYYGGDLVSIETEHEWQVLKDQIQNRSNRFNNSWHIGLRINSSGNWTWVSGKPLTINRWQPWQPRDGAPYAVMARNYSPVTKGFFNSVRRSIFAGFICEKPAECSRRSVICEDQGKIIQIQTSSRTQSSETSRPPTRKTTNTARETKRRRKSESIVMVEKAQPPSGYIHWTVAVIPLGSVIVALLCVITFLLWRLKHRTRKQDGANITVSPMHYDVKTRSILNNPEEKVKNDRGSNDTRVHFQEPNNYEAPKECHALEQTTKNANGLALPQNPVDCPIPRRLAIKRKNNKELEGKYPLDKSENEAGNKVDCPIPRRLAMKRKNSKELEGKYPLNKSDVEIGNEEKENTDSCWNPSTRDNEDVRNSSHETRQAPDYKKPLEVV